jgi:integrase
MLRIARIPGVYFSGHEWPLIDSRLATNEGLRLVDARSNLGEVGMVKVGGRRLPMGISMERGKYRVRLYVNGFQHSLGMYTTLTDARAALDIARGQKARGTFVPPAERRRAIQDAKVQAEDRSVTVREWADTWLAQLAADDKSPGTIRAHRSLLRVHVLPTIGNMQITEVTKDDIDQLIAQVKALPSTRHSGAKTNGVWSNVARTLRAMFNAAVDAEAGGLTVSPVKVTVPKNVRVVKAEDRTDVATAEQVQKLTEAMPEHLAIAIPLAAWCSLRLGEVLGLQRRDFEHLDDPTRATLHVRRQWNTKASPPRYADPKAGSARTVAIPAGILPAIVEHLDRFTDGRPTAPLLPSKRDPLAPVSQTSIDAAWRTAREGVLPGFKFHSLRHTGLTAYAQQGATLVELMARGGHKSSDVALRYQHASEERDRALTSKLNGMIDGEK